VLDALLCAESLEVKTMLRARKVEQNRLMDRLRHLPRDKLLAMYYAAADATECAAALAHRGTNPVTEVLDGAEVVDEWIHFPRGDVVDPNTHSQYYYHTHATAERVGGEHGHFHTFVHPKKLAPQLAPAPVPEGENPEDEAGWITHLVGISTDASGHPIRLFTTNRWVTGEVWYDADAVLYLLDRFDITVDKPSHDLNRWVTAVVRMFRPQIVDLVRDRDLRIAEFKAAHPGRNVFEDRALPVTSEMPVDFLNQIRAIETALDLLQPAA
jgi:hypothetical protein